MTLAAEGKLTMVEIREHHDYLARLTRLIADEGARLRRSFGMALAKSRSSVSTDAKRASAHDRRADAIRRLEQRYNNEVAMTQREVDWLQTSPAFKQAMDFLDEHWVKTSKGDFVSKKDLHEDATVSFEDMLSALKEEQEQKQQQLLDASLPRRTL